MNVNNNKIMTLICCVRAIYALNDIYSTYTSIILWLQERPSVNDLEVIIRKVQGALP